MSSASCPPRRCCAPPGKVRDSGVGGGRLRSVGAARLTRCVRVVLQRVPAVEGVRPADASDAAANRVGVGAGAGPRREPHAGARAGARARGEAARAPPGRAGRGSSAARQRPWKQRAARPGLSVTAWAGTRQRRGTSLPGSVSFPINLLLPLLHTKIRVRVFSSRQASADRC